MYLLPRHPPGLHPVCKRDVVAPDVKLPLPEADDAAEHVARVDPNAHVHGRPGHLPNGPKIDCFNIYIFKLYSYIPHQSAAGRGCSAL
jgi:hypothetical protein